MATNNEGENTFLSETAPLPEAIRDAIIKSAKADARADSTRAKLADSFFEAGIKPTAFYAPPSSKSKTNQSTCSLEFWLDLRECVAQSLPKREAELVLMTNREAQRALLSKADRELRRAAERRIRGRIDSLRRAVAERWDAVEKAKAEAEEQALVDAAREGDDEAAAELERRQEATQAHALAKAEEAFWDAVRRFANADPDRRPETALIAEQAAAVVPEAVAFATRVGWTIPEDFRA